MARNPCTDPREGDELCELRGRRVLLVDHVHDGEVAYRVTDGAGGLLAAYRVDINYWRTLARTQCVQIPTGENDGGC